MNGVGSVNGLLAAGEGLSVVDPGRNGHGDSEIPPEEEAGPNGAALVEDLPATELPDEAHFKCSCGALLAISKDQYEKRSRCPVCNARMLVFMLYDSRARTFTLQLFSLVDRSSGTTQVLSKL